MQKKVLYVLFFACVLLLALESPTFRMFAFALELDAAVIAATKSGMALFKIFLFSFIAANIGMTIIFLGARLAELFFKYTGIRVVRDESRTAQRINEHINGKGGFMMYCAIYILCALPFAGHTLLGVALAKISKLRYAILIAYFGNNTKVIYWPLLISFLIC